MTAITARGRLAWLAACCITGYKQERKGSVLTMGKRGLAPAIGALAMLAIAPAQAQFGGLLGRTSTTSSNSPPAEDNGGCPRGKKGSAAGRSVLRGVIGGALGSAASRVPFASFVPVSEVAGTLTDAIACRLDPGEQLQAAKATDEVVRGEAVGTTAAWTSETRPGVSGSSTIVARNDEAGGMKCMNVTDFVIVDGEETRVTKKMCKKPGEARYQIAAA